MNWQTILGGVAALIAIGGYVWYKVREAAGQAADALAAQTRADQADAARKVLEEQAAVRAASEKKEVQDAIDDALSKSGDERAKAALAVLARVRGKL
jgi:hypothetical protein